MKLYEMTKDYIDLLESDMPAEDLVDCLDSIKDSIDEKASNIVKVVSCLDGDTNAIDEQIRRLQARKKAITNNKDRMKEYLRMNMEATGISKIKHPLFNITLGKPSVTVDILDEGLIPDDYISVQTIISPDKRRILSDLKAGVDIPGAALSQGKSRLLIK